MSMDMRTERPVATPTTYTRRLRRFGLRSGTGCTPEECLGYGLVVPTPLLKGLICIREPSRSPHNVQLILTYDDQPIVRRGGSEGGMHYVIHYVTICWGGRSGPPQEGNSSWGVVEHLRVYTL